MLKKVARNENTCNENNMQKTRAILCKTVEKVTQYITFQYYSFFAILLTISNIHI